MQHITRKRIKKSEQYLETNLSKDIYEILPRKESKEERIGNIT